jgi:hypothetical protein
MPQPKHRSHRKALLAGTVVATAALTLGVLAITHDDNSSSLPITTTVPTTAPSTNGSANSGLTPGGTQPSGGSANPGGTSGSPSTGGNGSDGSSSTGGNGSSGSGGQSPSSQLPDLGQLPNLGQLPDLSGQSIDQIIREILRQLGIDPNTVIPSNGSNGSSTNGGN